MSSETIKSRAPRDGGIDKSGKIRLENNSYPKNSDTKPTLDHRNTVKEKLVELHNEETSTKGPQTSNKTCLNEVERQLTDGVAGFWQSKAFSDIEIHCGIDGGVVLAHRILLAAISPFLRKTLQSLPANDAESIILLIPDISSEDINYFLSMVCCGSTEPAVIKKELTYLGFSHDSYLKLELVPQQKREANNFKNIIRNDIQCMNTGDQQSYEDDYGANSDDNTNGLASSSNILPEIVTPSAEDGKIIGLKTNQTNLIWNYFTSKDNRHAVCKTCSTDCKTNLSNTSTLSRHLRNSHPKLYKEFISAKRVLINLESTFLKKENLTTITDTSSTLTGSSAKSSLVWNYFTPLQNDRTKCNSCNQEMRTFDGSTSGMLRHLRRNHEELYNEWKSKKEKRQYNTILGNSLHPIWSHFEENKETKEYICLICNSTMELPDMQLLLLEKHLKEYHDETFKDYSKKLMDEKVLSDFDVSTNGGIAVGGFHGKFSRVWELYEQIEKDKAKCNECGTILRVFSNSTSGLLRHIKRHHETLYKEFNKSKNQQPIIDLNNISNIQHPIWNCYTKKDEPPGLNCCKECEKEIDSDDLPQLVNHLKAFHPEKHLSYEESSKKYIETLTMSSLIAKSRKTGIRSAIWKYFKQTENRALNNCSICGVKIKCNKMGTSNMIRHLERYHSNEYENFLQENSSNVISTGESTPLSNTGTKTKQRRGPKPKIEDKDPAEKTCPDCGKSFSGRAAMRFHKRVVHSGIRPYKCDECGMTFARGDSFKGHTHSKTRSFLCTICGKTFGRKNIRDQHERAHRGDRRYNCNYCNRKFMTNQQRMNHERVHTGEKPYQVVL